MRHRIVMLAVLCLSVATAHAQFGGIRNAVNKVNEAKDKLDKLVIDEQDEIAIGEQVSSRIRARYGVLQDPATHKYVALVGSVIARKSERPALPWQFIILDTDGVNAFAAPGGYIHITRGALAMMKSEAELAGVLAHEIAHVTQKHTVKAIEKDGISKLGLTEAKADTKLKDQPAVFQKLADKAYEGIFAGFGRAEELEADEGGPVFSARVGYAPSGLPQFLRTLDQRNKDSDQKQGLFTSHPEMKERLEKLDKAIAKDKSGATATVDARFTGNVKYQVIPIGALAVGAEAAATPEAAARAEEKQSTASRFGNVLRGNTTSNSSESKQSASVTGSAGSRGVDRERAAKGGSNPNKIAVSVTDAEVSAFIAEGKLKA